MWVKICGNMRKADCLAAADAGADAVGFIFAPSKRQMRVPEVAAITRELPKSLVKVGVFSGRSAEEVAFAANNAGLTAVQLHDLYDAERIRALRELVHPDTRIYQTLHWHVNQPPQPQGTALRALADKIVADNLVDLLLLDSVKADGQTGGTGTTLDWVAASQALSSLQFPIVLAGGLRTDNVADAVRRFRPWGVDVSSGVELAPGVKSIYAMRDFVKATRVRIYR